MFKSQKKASPFVEFANRIGQTIDNQAATLSTKESTAQFLSFESLQDPTVRGNIETNAAGTAKDVKEMLISLGDELGLEGYREGSNELEVASQAAACIMLAAGDPLAYAQKAYAVEALSDSAERGRVMPLNMAGTDYRVGRPAMESFDERELSSHLPFSVAFAAFAARQDEFAEAFFPTTVVTPDQAGLDIEITIPKVFTNSDHPTNGTPTNFDKRNLIEAAVNFDILKDEATKLVPAVAADGTNAALFVDEDVVGNRFIRVAGIDVPTRPLAIGKDIGLLGISAYGPLMGAGILNNTDAVDSSIVLEDLIVQFADDEKGVRFGTLLQPRNTFTKTVEGNFRDMQLTFGSSSMILDGDKRATDATTPAVVTTIATQKWKVYLQLEVSGKLNTELSSVKVGAFPVSVDKILDENGNEVGLSAGPGAALKTALEAGKIVGYTLKANRTNSNLRTRGHVVDTTVERERHTIPLGSPITYPSPIHATGRDSDIKIAINAARFRNSNMAVTALLAYRDALAAVVKGPKRTDGVVPGIAGAGRWVIQPWFESQKLDVSESINSDKSYERAADVSLTLVNAIRDMAYRMYQDSWYQAALDSVSGGSGEKPTLLIGTDSVIERHLMVSGDDRTFGTAFDKFKVVSSLDKRVYGKIFLTFTRGSADPSDVLSFGTHAWMPELTSSLPINRQGSTYREAMVQPRNLHVPKLPILGVIEVQGLSKALTSKTSKLQVGKADINNPYLPAKG